MQPHQQRVVDEKAARDQEIGALQDFIAHSPVFETLSPAERGRLTTQCHIMCQLSAILDERIQHFQIEPTLDEFVQHSQIKLTFDEFVQYGRNNGANIVDGMPWSFVYHGRAVTHENNQRYLIATGKPGIPTVDFTPSDIIVLDVSNRMYIRKAY